ncbi:MAG: AMP-binding protein [Candidatus Rifleibacteriota bacterium]
MTIIHKPALTDDERFPLLNERRLLNELRQDSHAPKFNFASGDRLDKEALQRVKKYARQIKKGKFWQPGSFPADLPAFYRWCREKVPAYRNYPEDFTCSPTMRREAIAARPWLFVADDSRLEDLLVYSTSGTTGSPMPVLFDPGSQACWIPQLESILDQDGIKLEGGPERVSICLVCLQKETLTYASLSTYLNGAGVLKINLNLSDWSSPGDPVAYLEKYDPEIITGDPFTLMALIRMAPDIRPKAMVSSAMVLQQGLRKKLEKHFKCPIYDIYSLTECRMIAVSRKPGVHRLIRPELFVEIMDPDRDVVLPDGEVGEIVVTGGSNPFLPFVRYRTGDFARIHYGRGFVELHDLQGRAPCILVDDTGRFVNNVDVSRELCRFMLAGYSLHQKADRSVIFCGWGENVEKNEIKKTLQAIFGEKIKLRVSIKTEILNAAKKVQFSSDIEKADFNR